MARIAMAQHTSNQGICDDGDLGRLLGEFSTIRGDEMSKTGDL